MAYKTIGPWTFEVEYRINKKGREYFRSGNREQAMEMLSELQAKRPGVYTIQYRDRSKHKTDRVYREWSPWKN